MGIKEKLENRPKLRKLVIAFLSSTKHPRPRFYTRWFINPLFHKKGSGSSIHKRGARLDLFPWHRFDLGKNVVIEEQCLINNGAGDIIIDDGAFIGIGSIITGPVSIGKGCVIGQRMFISGFNHGYEDVNMEISKQPLIIRESSIGDNTHIGTNITILPGVHIGNRCVIGAGSVVTKNIPDYCVAAGNPARVIKKYNKESNKWELL